MTMPLNEMRAISMPYVGGTSGTGAITDGVVSAKATNEPIVRVRKKIRASFSFPCARHLHSPSWRVAFVGVEH